eukprot:COSAG04_NODE_1019_length_8734_cov_2.287319_3_plen_92_part_00
MAEASAPAAPTTTRLRRCTIYGLLMGDILALKIPRLSIPSMVPFIVADLNLPPSAVPALLSAFHPGCARCPTPPHPAPQHPNTHWPGTCIG